MIDLPLGVPLALPDLEVYVAYFNVMPPWLKNICFVLALGSAAALLLMPNYRSLTYPPLKDRP